jgi:hypothetical protein
VAPWSRNTWSVNGAGRDLLKNPSPGEELQLREGLVIGGRFQLGRRLGEGGMGTVYAAVHLQLGQMVALKFLRDDRDKAAVERFLREARAAARLKNVHITRVFDVGRLDTGTPFIVMEYLEGETLHALIARRAPVVPEDAALYALQICEALADAHAHGIVHRDLKPANLMLARGAEGPIVKVLDFGVSKVLADLAGESGLTTTGTVVGSPSYAAPEQVLDSRNVDARADVWGVGVTLYALLSHELPFVGETRMQTYMSVLNATPVHLHERCPEVPAAFADAIMRCLAKDRGGRHADVAELARAVEPFAPAAAQGRAMRVARALAEQEDVDAVASDSAVLIGPGLDDLATTIGSEVAFFGVSAVVPSPASGDPPQGLGAGPPGEVADRPPGSSGDSHEASGRARKRWVTGVVVGLCLASVVLIFALRPTTGLARPDDPSASQTTIGEPPSSSSLPSTAPGQASPGAAAAAPATGAAPGASPSPRRGGPSTRDFARRDPRSYR